MNRRNPKNRSQQQGGYSGDQPRQADQWQAEPPRQTGEQQEGGGYHPAYDDYMRPQNYRSSGMDSPTPTYSAPYPVGEPEMQERQDYRRDRDYEQSREASQRNYPRHSQHFYDGTYGSDFSSFTSEDYGGRDFYGRRGGITGGMGSSDTYRPSYGVTRWFESDYDDRHARDYGEWRAYGERRGFLERAGDEIASWFGDEDAARRREMDHSGRGPSDYTRSDERIREDANDHLTHDRRVDATNISVSVSNGEVTLSGTVHDRWAKRRAEDCVDRVPGVKHVQNNLRVADANLLSADKSASGWSSATSGTTPSATLGSEKKTR